MKEKIYKEPNKTEMETTINVLYDEKKMIWNILRQSWKRSKKRLKR